MQAPSSGATALDNGAVLAQLLLKRHQLATLLGYESWAHYAGEETMLKTPAAVQAFIERRERVGATNNNQAIASTDQVVSPYFDLSCIN